MKKQYSEEGDFGGLYTFHARHDLPSQNHSRKALISCFDLMRGVVVAADVIGDGYC